MQDVWGNVLLHVIPHVLHPVLVDVLIIHLIMMGHIKADLDADAPLDVLSIASGYVKVYVKGTVSSHVGMHAKLLVLTTVSMHAALLVVLDVPMVVQERIQEQQTVVMGVVPIVSRIATLTVLVGVAGLFVELILQEHVSLIVDSTVWEPPALPCALTHVLFSVLPASIHVDGNVVYVLPSVLQDVPRLVISHAQNLVLIIAPITVFILVQKNVEDVLIFAILVSECVSVSVQ